MENNNEEKLIDCLPDGITRYKWWNKQLKEIISELRAERKELRKENGALKAYIEELEENKKKTSQSRELEKQQTSNKEKNETIKELRKSNNYLRGQIKTCQKIIKQKDKIINKYERKN